MKADETVKIIKRLNRAYPRYWDSKDMEGIIEVWHEALEPAPFDCVDEAVGDYIRECKAPPTIADIFQRALEVYHSKYPTM